MASLFVCTVETFFGWYFAGVLTIIIVLVGGLLLFGGKK